MVRFRGDQTGNTITAIATLHTRTHTHGVYLAIRTTIIVPRSRRGRLLHNNIITVCLLCCLHSSVIYIP